MDPLARRTSWLESTIDALGLANVTVHRGRAESLWGGRRFDAVTARAVARTAELARVCLPLLRAGGSLHALKGDRAEQELAEDRDQLAAFGAVETSITRHGVGLVDPETVVLTLLADAAYTLGTPASATANITSDDLSTVTLAVVDAAAVVASAIAPRARPRRSAGRCGRCETSSPMPGPTRT